MNKNHTKPHCNRCGNTSKAKRIRSNTGFKDGICRPCSFTIKAQEKAKDINNIDELDHIIKNGKVLFKTTCTVCNKKQQYSIISNGIDRVCKPCVYLEKAINEAKTLNNVNELDYIMDKDRYEFKTSCIKCGTDRGYKRLSKSNNTCKSCSGGWNYTRTPEHREAISKRMKENPSTRLGKPHTEQTKQKLSKKQKEYCKKFGNQFVTGKSKGKHTKESLIKMSKSNMGKEPRWKGRVFQYDGPNGYFKMRSSYELAYSEWLDENKIEWEYEPLYELSNGMWFSPDFKLKDGTIVEIKGYWLEKSRLKWELFKEDNPDLITKVLYKQDLIDLNLNVK